MLTIMFYPCKPDIFAVTYEPVDADRLAAEARAGAGATRRDDDAERGEVRLKFGERPCTGLPDHICASCGHEWPGHETDCPIAPTPEAGIPVDRVKALEEALRDMVYETTHLSPMRPDGSHNCIISAAALGKARAALATPSASEPQTEREEVAGPYGLSGGWTPQYPKAMATGIPVTPPAPATETEGK